jgi:hypothetical protein
MTMNDSEVRRIPRLQVGLVLLQLGFALLAAGLDLARACGACSTDGSFHLIVAVAGVLGYAALLGVTRTRRTSLFTTGVFVATGVHAALGSVLVAQGTLCLPCIASLAVAAVLTVLVVRHQSVASSQTFLPATALSGAATVLLFVTLSGPAHAQSAELPVRRQTVPQPGIGRTAESTLDVYEAVHCPYCRDFRTDYLPLLESDYQGRLAVRFHEAWAAGWVKRTPTFVLDGKLLFEGLPYHYQDLAAAVDAELSGQRR